MVLRALTDFKIQSLKPQPGRYEISDPAARGLRVVVFPSGVKSFIVRYRFAGTQKKLTLQSGVSLAAARKFAAEAMHDVALGKDPCRDKQEAQTKAAESARDTLRAVCSEFLAREGKNLRSANNYKNILERLVYGKLGHRPIDSIERIEVSRLLDGIEDNNGPRMADVTLAILRRVFNWHATRSNRFSSPIVKGMARSKSAARSRILGDEELRAVWKATDSKAPFRALIRFLLLTAARRNEAAALPWAEIDGTDWILPPERNKAMARRPEQTDLIRPLSKAAQAVLDDLPRIVDCPHVFTTDGKHPVSGFSWLKTDFDRACGVTGWTLHDLRRTARSLMSRAGVNPDVAERCLGHVIPGVRGVYDRYAFHKEMMDAYETLAAQIERIVNPQDNVTPLRQWR
jgi:integrase